ncbi:PAS domain S-box protein [Labilibacter sediminis]|nr:PAS domain S-box protein [Labilibacter sediminis]
MHNLKRYSSIFFLLIFGIVISFKLYVYEKNEAHEFQGEYINQHVRERKIAIVNEFNTIFNLLRLFEHDWDIPNQEFEQLASPILKSYKGIQNICWVNEIYDSVTLNTLRLKLQQQGILDFQLQEIDEQGEFIPARERMRYYPAVYSCPNKIMNNAFRGFDFASKKMVYASIQSSLNNRQLTLTNCALTIGDTTMSGMLTILPIYNKLESKDVEALLIARLQLDKILEHTLAQFKEENISVTINDHTDSINPILLAEYHAPVDIVKVRQRQTYTHSFKIPFYNKLLNLEFQTFTPVTVYEDANMMLYIGLIITVILSVYMLIWKFRTLKIENITKRLQIEIEDKKKIESVLKQSEEKFRILYEKAPLSYQSLNKEGCFIDVNKAWLTLMGYQKNEVIGHCFYEFMSVDSKLKFNKSFNTFIQSGKVRNAELVLVTKDGKHIVVSLDGNVMYNMDGSFKQTHCIFSDITEKKNIEAEIKKKQYYLEKAQEIGQIGTWEYDFQNTRMYWTKENFRLFDLPENSRLSYERFLDTVHPDDRNFVEKQWEKGIKEHSYNVEHRIITNKKIKWIRQRADFIVDEQGILIRAIGVAQDVTQQKNAEQVIRESEAKYRAAFITSPDAVCITTMDGYYVDVNEGFTAITGFSRNDAIGHSALDLNLWHIKADREALLSELNQKGQCKNLEAVFRCKNGQLITGMMSANFIHIDGVPHILTITRDITRQKQHDKEILNTIIETQEAERRKFAEDLHDELGPFLSGIKLYIKELAYNNDDREKRLSMIEYLSDFVNSAVEKTRSISNDLMPNVLTSYGIKAALKSFCYRIEKVSALKINLNINIESLDDKSRELALYRIIIELINNTIKHAVAKNIKIDLLCEGQKLTCRYADDGKGFDFNKAVNDHHGIGLRSVIGRLSSIDGKYNVVSSPQKGFQFDIYMNTGI